MAYQNGSGNAGKCPKGVLIGGEPPIHELCQETGDHYSYYAGVHAYVDKLAADGMGWREAYRMDREWADSWFKCSYGLEP